MRSEGPLSSPRLSLPERSTKAQIRNFRFFSFLPVFLSVCAVIPIGREKRFELHQTGKEDSVDADFLLIRKMKQGDDQAFDTFVRRYYGDILRYCGYRCPDIKDAEDLTQETFVRFFTKLSDYRHIGKAKNYLYTIAGNLCRNFSRQAKTVSSDDEQLEERLSESEQAHAGPKDAVEKKITDRVALEWALNQLQPEFRQVIDRYYFQEMKMTEIAEDLRISLSLVKYRLKQAKKRLRELLRDPEPKESRENRTAEIRSGRKDGAAVSEKDREKSRKKEKGETEDESR